jgi:DNA primase
VESIREATDIAAVIGRVVQLTRAGRSLKGLCPFHREKTPSFHVSVERQTFHCFGCGVGGDVFSFVMSYHGLSFREALEELASEAGIELSRDQSPDPSGRLRGILAEAASHFARTLWSPAGARARAYLSGRGIDDGTGRTLELGYAPQAGLLDHLSGLGFSRSQAVDSGLAVRSESGSVYERFRDRLVFPIKDRRGRTVSFGGRSLGDAEPKYLNGPDSPVYRKGDLLYGHSWAAGAARDTDTVVLVEGYFDHARLYGAGLHNVVATCGTALTQGQARQLRTLAPGIIVCYDGDDAGRKASVRASEILMAEGCWPGVASLEGDPDEFVEARGLDEFISRLESAVDPVAFALAQAGGWAALKASGKAVPAIRRLLSMAGGIRDPVLLETFLGRVSELCGYTMDTLRSQLRMDSGRDEKPRVRATDSGWDQSLAVHLLSGEGGGTDPELLSALLPGDFDSEPYRSLLAELSSAAAAGLSRPVAGTMSPDLASLYATLSMSSGVLGDEDRKAVMRKVLARRRRLRHRELAGRLEGADPEDGRRILHELSRGDEAGGGGEVAR